MQDSNEIDTPGTTQVVELDRETSASDATVTSLEFNGKAGEYFGVWIVNILLSIVTLGIYSAWAKVRNRRYFYGHTTLDEHSFDYLANPITILKGRMIAVVFLAAYLSADYFAPGSGVIVALIIWLAIPWLIVKGRIFNAHNTAYRNIRFNFFGRTKEALSIYIFLPLLTAITLGILYPYVAYRTKRYFVDNHGFGKSKFSLLKRDIGYFYKIYLSAIAIFFAIVALFAVLFADMSAMLIRLATSDGTEDIPLDQSQIFLTVMGIYVLLIFIGLTVSTFIQTRITNHVWSNSQVGDSLKFKSTLRYSRMLLIYFTNVIAIIASLGFAIPWAKVRLWRYRAENFHIIHTDNLDLFLSDKSYDASATGEEVGEFFDVDMGF